MRKIKMLVAGLALLMATGIGALAVNQPAYAAKCPEGSKNETYTNNLAECNVEETEGKASLMGRADTIINVALGVIGLVAVVMIIFGGFFYVTSQGNPENVKKGKNTIMYGVIGLVVALLAFAIVNFVLSEAFGGGSSGDDANKKDDTSKTEDKKD